jgi:hypothetical protein
MIHEYALEPELVATWTDRSTCRYFKESFGLGQGRVVSRYPKRWKRLVWDSFDSTDDFARKRLEELLASLSEQMVQRSDARWDGESTSWRNNAESEHERLPFHAILARTNPKNHAHVLTENDIDEDSAVRWVAERGCSVERNAAKMADSVAPLLRCSSDVIFVDPYFRPGRKECQRPFAAFLERMVSQRPGKTPKRVEVHTAADNTGTEEFFREECERKLCGWVPERIQVLVRRLKQKQNGEKLHNRYILTDLGGVTFGIGLDEGNEGETDDITLMDRGQYELRWSQYGGNPPAGFDQEETPVEVVGTRKLPTPS